MRTATMCAVVMSAALGLSTVAAAQAQQDADRKVEGGGVTVPGWTGKEDAGNRQGLTVKDSKLAPEGAGFRLVTGPAALYWNPKNAAKGDFSVTATFTESKQSFSHPHPYGVFIGGANLDSATPTALYCVAYRNGNYIVRMFSAGKRVDIVGRPAPGESVAKGPAEAEVVQKVAWSVKGGKVECLVNDKPVWSGTTADVVGDGKLASTDGIVGIRVSHNSDALVTGFALGK